jgi:predicted porin
MKRSSEKRGARLLRIVRIAACLIALNGALSLRAQTPYKLDIAASYLSQYSLAANTSQNFWLQGGSIELGTNTYRGLGAVVIVSGTHGSSIGSSGIPLSIVSAVFGGRYRWHADHKMSLYVEGLAGEANGFRSLFPSITGAQTSANGWATQAGGGVDYSLSKRLSVRVLEAAWARTTLPNATISIEDNFQVGSGVVYKFGH